MAIKWPATIEQLEAAGYGYTGTAKICSCGTRILWFITPGTPAKPRAKWMPFSALKDSRLVPHHAVCQRVKEFRDANKQLAERVEAKKPKQQELF